MRDIYFTVKILNDDYWVAVFIGRDNSKLKKLLKNHFKEDVENKETDDYGGKMFYQKGYTPFIWVNTKTRDTRAKIYETLTHEAIHAVDDIFNFIGSPDRHEIFAHSVASIIRGYNKFN